MMEPLVPSKVVCGYTKLDSELTGMPGIFWVGVPDWPAPRVLLFLASTLVLKAEPKSSWNTRVPEILSPGTGLPLLSMAWLTHWLKVWAPDTLAERLV